MKIINSLDSHELAESIKNGGLAVLPTDTLYGIHASVLNPKAVEKVYEIKGRTFTKPMIVLIASVNDLNHFKIEPDEASRRILEKYWPGKVSIVLPCLQKEFEYLHRGKKSLAIRFPDKADLISLLQKTGPLISTTVNPEGLPPAKNLKEAIAYFGHKIDYYVDVGELDSPPSTLIEIKNGKVVVLRPGAVRIGESDQAIS